MGGTRDPAHALRYDSFFLWERLTLDLSLLCILCSVMLVLLCLLSRVISHTTC